MTIHRRTETVLFAAPVSIHVSWLPLAALLIWRLAEAVFPAVSPGLSSADYWAMASASALLLFGSIVLHEAAHSLAAHHYDLPARGVTLYIFGGVAGLDGEPAPPSQEIFIALAGPAASLLLAMAAFAGEAAAAGRAPDAAVALLWYLGYANGSVALFNLLPGLPLDGGRILRAALWVWRRDRMWATMAASGAGALLGVALMVAGGLAIIGGNPAGGLWRLMIGLVLRGAAVNSYRDAMVRSLIGGSAVETAMRRLPLAIPPTASVAAMVERFVGPSRHHSFPVVAEGRLIGSVGVRQLTRIEGADWATTPVGEVMTPVTEKDVIGSDADLLLALTRMRRGRRRKLWVVDDGRLVGVLSMRDLQRLLLARIVLDRRHGDLPPRWVHFSLLG